MKAMQTLAAGLVDGVHESQQTFRALLEALARPGQTRLIGPALPGVALGGALARLLLCLSDDETPVWWQQAHAGLQQWLRFHTGATLTQQPALAAFAVLTDVSQGLVLADFAVGTAESPEFSGTLLIELPSLTGGPALEWRGPGIQELQRVALQGLPADFWTQWQANHAAFPQGVDIVFTCGELALGLPRTTRVRRLEGV
ncbi:MAG: phosphonate C-P lyase system protein PhnH [Rhodoferax sp.]|nr:phosphonate C-P lyase system protein PhnH [Rhodoferax sp.]